MIREGLLPMNLQFFANEGADEETGLDLNTILDGMGTGEGDAGTDDNIAEEEEEEDGDDIGDEGAGEEDNAAAEAAAKQNHAWAELRAQNTQLKTMLGKIAQATGIEYADDKDLVAKLDEDTLNKLAKKQNVPVELLQRLDMLEQRDKANAAQQLQQEAFIGFQRIKDTYKLDEEELKAFASKLDETGKNPFLQKVNLDAEYKTLFFDTIVEKQVNAAVEAALKKSGAADTHSTKPSAKSGQKDTGSPDKVTTVAGLGSLLDKLQ